VVKHIQHIAFLILLLTNLLVSPASAQNIDAFARVSVSPREGVVRQPYKVTIHVYSSTWFAKPLQFANLQVENAFIIPFARTLSSIDYINNKKYATLSFYYLVFPYETGDMIIPELEINTSIPPEGGYQGEPVTIKTKQQKIRVGAVPSSKDQPVWMVAKNVSLNENWSKDLQNLKVGDVVERRITISAEGTLPSLISPLEIKEPENVSVYPAQPELQDKRNDKDANGVRTESYSYLLEKEGEVLIPEQVVTWWNPVTKKVYQRKLAEHRLSVAANSDLTMMESLKDSLLALNSPPVDEESQNPFPWMKLLLGLPLILILYFIIKLLRRLIQKITNKKQAYRESEAWYYKQAELALKNQDVRTFINALYQWFDRARKPNQSAAITYYLNHKQRVELEQLVVSNVLTVNNRKQIKSILTILRTKLNLLNKDTIKTDKLNPG
jgi:hypothetical protein